MGLLLHHSLLFSCIYSVSLFFVLVSWLIFIINSSMVSKGYCPPVPQHCEGWTWYSFSYYAMLPSGSYVVVRNYWSHFLCISVHRHQNHSDSTPYLGHNHCYYPVIHLFSPFLHCSGHQQPASLHASDIWTHFWLHASREAYCKYYIQDSWIHSSSTSQYFCRRPEARALHEGSSSHYVRYSTCPYCYYVYLGYFYSGVDA